MIDLRCVKTALLCTGTPMYTPPAGRPQNKHENTGKIPTNRLLLVFHICCSASKNSIEKIEKIFEIEMIFCFQEWLLQFHLLQRMYGDLDGGRGDTAEGSEVHKVRQI